MHVRWPRGSTRIAKRLQYRESARTHAAGICTGETYKDRVKITFAQGAALDDPHEVFNASLGGNTRRAIDLREGDELDDEAFKGLVAAADRGHLPTDRADRRQVVLMWLPGFRPTVASPEAREPPWTP